MPLLAALIKAGLANLYALYLALASARYAALLAVMVAMAGTYVAFVVAWSVYISPLFSLLFSTGFGHVIGLAFPPIAGTVVAGYAALWALLVAKNYAMKFVGLGVK